MKRNFKGQSLIEVVIGMGIATLLTVALVSTAIYTQKLAKSAKNNAQASKLVQQSIEQVRTVRDRNGFSAISANGCYKVDSASWNLVLLAGCSSPEIANPSHPAGDPDFLRTIAIANGTNPDQKMVTVTAAWTDSSGNRTVTNTTFLSKPCTGSIGGASPCP